MTPVSGRRGLSALRVTVVYLLHMPPYGRPFHANPLTSLLRIRGRRSALVAPQRRTDRDCRPGAQHWNLLAPPTSAADLASNAPQRRLQRSWRWALPNDLRRRTGVGTLPDDLYHGTWHRAERSERRWESLRDALPGLRPALPGLPGLLVTGDVARVRSTRARRSPQAGHLANGGHPLLPESAPWGFLSGWGWILVRTPSLAAE